MAIKAVSPILLQQKRKHVKLPVDVCKEGKCGLYYIEFMNVAVHATYIGIIMVSLCHFYSVLCIEWTLLM